MAGCLIVAAPGELIIAAIQRQRTNLYRNANAPRRRKKSPHTFHSREL